MSWIRLLDRLLRRLTTANRKASATVSTDAFERLKAIADEGIIAFCKDALGFEPTEYQAAFLEETAQFQAQCWCRQSGKDHAASSKLLWFAVENEGSQLAVVGPSFRQSKLVIRKINNFLQNKLPKEIPYREVLVGRKALRTKVPLVNGAVIEAYPCNPDTIRGPTLNGILATEFNFVKDDEEMYDAILFTLGTTNGFFIANSTPWSRDHIFYRIMNDKDYEDYKRFHVTWKEALEPGGPLKKNILAKIQRQFASDPWRWRREMEAEWSENESCWLPQALIGQCQDSMLEIRVIDKRHSFWTVN
jgi:phage terminase large subunit-like protein